MDHQNIIAAVEAEIARLSQVRELLAQNGKSVISAKVTKKAIVKQAKKRVMSPEARAKIAAAQKKRWAKSKRAAKKVAVTAAAANV